MIRKISLFLFAFILGGNIVNAQESTKGAGGPAFDQLFTFAWDINIPTGNKFVDETSLAGGKLEFRKMLQNNLSVGFDFSWNSFYQFEPYQTYSLNSNTDITTELYKYNYTLPLAVTVHKYFPGGGQIIPYAGFGIGATYSQPSVYVSVYQIYDDTWGFLIRPELGAIVKFQRDGDVGILVGARYSYSTNSSDSFKIDGLESLGFQLGMVWVY